MAELTPDELARLLALPAGLELDLAVVALTGWRHEVNPGTRTVWVMSPGETAFREWRPSRDIAAAWLIVAELDRRGYACGLWTPTEAGGPHRAVFLKRGKWAVDCIAGEGPSPEVALCRAGLAVAAKEVTP